MRRFEIVVDSSRPGEGGSHVHRLPLGRLGSVIAAALLLLIALVVVTTALVLGYLIVGLLGVAFLVAIMVALIRGAFRSVRR
jgi:hypothetical protein